MPNHQLEASAYRLKLSDVKKLFSSPAPFGTAV